MGIDIHKLSITNSKFWDGLRFIQNDLSIKDSSFAAESEISFEKFQFLKNNEIELPVYNLMKLSRSLNIPLDKLASGDVSAHLNRASLFHQWKQKIDDKYQTNEGSRSFSLRHVLQIAKKYHIYQKTLDHFRLPSYFFDSHVDYNVSVQIVIDMLDFVCANAPVSDQDFLRIGHQNAFYFKNSAFGKLLSSSRNSIEVYENLFFVSRYIEENWCYTITKAKDNKIILTSSPTDKLLDVYKTRYYSSENFTRLRASVIGQFGMYIGIQGSKTYVTKSMRNGDSCYEFIIDNSQARQLDLSCERSLLQ